MFYACESVLGTGKTLAFVLPLVERMLKQGTRPVRMQTQVLILEPTRELAKYVLVRVWCLRESQRKTNHSPPLPPSPLPCCRQVATEIEKLDPRFSVAAIYGGAAFGPQAQMLRSGKCLVFRCLYVSLHFAQWNSVAT